MLRLPGNLTAESFLKKHWQKRALFMPGAQQRLRPAVTRNELGWLATLDDVESRIVFAERQDGRCRYRVETGPFDSETLANLPKRDWTLLVHDVEKHIPAMRALFKTVPFVPDWRIDDLMVSFAAPGGGVGPHLDNYDVFLCQGIGVRNWHFSDQPPPSDPLASEELSLLSEFSGTEIDAAEGDILYLPPGTAHWGTARRACITYSIGMRAPEAADLAYALDIPTPDENTFYRDPDLNTEEAIPGYVSEAATRRALTLLGLSGDRHAEVATALGRFATESKDWLRPEGTSPVETTFWLAHLLAGGSLKVHGMSQIAFDDRNLFANGVHYPLPPGSSAVLNEICASRQLVRSKRRNSKLSEMLAFLLAQGVFEIPENARPYVK